MNLVNEIHYTDVVVFCLFNNKKKKHGELLFLIRKQAITDYVMVQENCCQAKIFFFFSIWDKKDRKKEKNERRIPSNCQKCLPPVRVYKQRQRQKAEKSLTFHLLHLERDQTTLLSSIYVYIYQEQICQNKISTTLKSSSV
jgi:hypothetical protein